jgi:hypothetical protein
MFGKIRKLEEMRPRITQKEKGQSLIAVLRVYLLHHEVKQCLRHFNSHPGKIIERLAKLRFMTG